MVTTTPIYHPLSHSGLKVPKLWLGAMMFGDQTSEVEARNIVDAPAQPRRRILRHHPERTRGQCARRQRGAGHQGQMTAQGGQQSSASASCTAFESSTITA